jgi:aldehyde:ferredoxin oxidoreductase
MYGMALQYGTTHGGGSGLFDAATICLFAAFPFYTIWRQPPEVARTFLNTACGWELTGQQLEDIAQRLSYLSRCVSLRKGFHSDKHSFLPQRAFDEPVTDKYVRTWVWTRED